MEMHIHSFANGLQFHSKFVLNLDGNLATGQKQPLLVLSSALEVQPSNSDAAFIPVWKSSKNKKNARFFTTFVFIILR